ncbi:unnamed protein product [Echinostoma caproni]|uniref:Furin-like domain-containing protein n=1 Tax=Echinostoma caproni TaxID=27848 RepID=A0A183ARX4_9TREM|nr:unnamed protein product [Echinostoma caproni]
MFCAHALFVFFSLLTNIHLVHWSDKSRPQCHVECAAGGCTGPAADQCLGGCRHFATQSRQCVAKCPPGTTPFGALRISITQQGLWEIHKRGRSRTKPGSVYPTGSAYDTVLSSRIRISDVQDQMHGLTNNVVCQPCWSLCAACVRPYTEYDCTACSNGRYLVPLITPDEGAATDGVESDLLLRSISDVQLPVVAGTCRTECPVGYYPNKTSSVCNRLPVCVTNQRLECTYSFTIVTVEFATDDASFDIPVPGSTSPDLIDLSNSPRHSPVARVRDPNSPRIE